MEIELLTKDDLFEAIKPLINEIEILKNKINSRGVKPRIMWMKDICEYLNVSVDWFNRNIERLPVQKSEKGRWYSFREELEIWASNQNL